MKKIIIGGGILILILSIIDIIFFREYFQDMKEIIMKRYKVEEEKEITKEEKEITKEQKEITKEQKQKTEEKRKEEEEKEKEKNGENSETGEEIYLEKTQGVGEKKEEIKVEEMGEEKIDKEDKEEWNFPSKMDLRNFEELMVSKAYKIRNPFGTKETEEFYTEEEKIEGEIRLESILIGEERKWAVINKKILKEGDEILGGKIEKILDNGIIIDFGGVKSFVGIQPIEEAFKEIYKK